MQQQTTYGPLTLITPTAAMVGSVHGGRAKCLQRLIRLDMPVPITVALSFDAVHEAALGNLPDMEALLAPFGDGPLLSVRPSSQDSDWGGPSAVLNVGMNDLRHASLTQTIGPQEATKLYLRFVQSYAIHVARLDPDEFYLPDVADASSLKTMLDTFEFETEMPFPQDAAVQLAEVLRSMARAWDGTTARLLRQAKGAPTDAGLGLVVQAMALGAGKGECGEGVMQFVDPTSGAPKIIGRYISEGQSQGRDVGPDSEGAIYLTRDPRGPSLEDLCPKQYAQLVSYGDICRRRLFCRSSRAFDSITYSTVRRICAATT